MLAYKGAMTPAPRRKSDDTRARIIEAARQHFAQFGFERTTIRGVAAQASIDPSMVMRYFGNKEGLFAEAAAFDLGMPDLSGVPQSEMGRRLLAHFLQRWDGKTGDDLLPVLIRTSASNKAAAEQMRLILQTQVAPALQSFVAEGEVSVRASLVASQILGLAFCRYVLDLDELRTGGPLVQAAVADTLQRYIFGDLEAASHSDA